MAVRSWVAALTVAAMGVAGTTVMMEPAGAAPERTPLVRGPVEHLVGTTGPGAAGPSIAVDDQGTATAVWRQAHRAADGTMKYRIRAARRGVGGRWSTPRTVGCRNSCPGAVPRVGVDATGAVTAAWSTGTTVTVARRPAAGPWHAPRVIATATTVRFPGGRLDMAVARNGAVFVVWNTARYRVWAAHRTAGGTWQTPVRIGYGGLAPEWVSPHPAVGASATGTAVVTFENGDVQAARFVPGHGWHVTPISGDGEQTHVAVGDGGRALVVWTPCCGDQLSDEWVRGREMTPAGVWGPVRRLWNHGLDAVPVIDSSGTESVAYRHFPEEPPFGAGMVARKPAGGAWTQTRVVRLPMSSGEVELPQLVVNRRNDLAVAFGGLLALRPHGSTWSAPASGRGAIAILPRGSALRMWWTTSGLVAQRLHLP